MKQPLSKYRWVILMISSLLCFISNHIQFQVSSLAYIIMPALSLTTAQFSSLLMAPSLTAVFLSIPSGMLGDRIGPKKVVTLGCIISVLGAYGRLAVASYPGMMAMMLATGVAICLLNANLIKVLGTWFQQDTSKATGIFYASSCAGIITAQMTGPLYPSVHTAYLVSSTVLLVGSILWLLYVKDCPDGMSLPEPEPALEYLKVAAKSKNTWIVAIAVGLGMGSTMAYAGILPQALTFGRGVEENMAGFMAAVVTIGSFVAALVGPAACGKLGKHKPFLAITTIVGAVFMCTTWYTPYGAAMWVVLALNGFFCALQGPIIQAMPIMFPEIGEKYAGSAGGIVGTASLLLSYTIPIIVATIAGENYAMNLGLEGLAFAASVICVVLLPEMGSEGMAAQQH